MPANLPEPRQPERLLVRRHLEMIVLDGEGPVLEMEGPRDRRALAPLARRGRLEAVRAIRRRRAKIHGRILIDGDEAPTRGQAARDARAHGTSSARSRA